MKGFIILAAVSALAVAKPELYKEQEDFQYSRSSTDEGTKSGFYGAQRGNMGGNYERAHNMDSLAQNQMSGLVNQVEGEIGDGAKTRTGSVYTAANSRGTYGSGHFDLSNLAGRNFQESTSYDSSQSSAAQSSAHRAGYTSSHSQSYGGSQYGGSQYGGAQYGGSQYGGSRSGAYQRGGSDAQIQTDDLQSLDHSQGSTEYGYGRQASHTSGYQTRSGLQERSEYDRSSADLHSGYGSGASGVRTRIISATPVRIVLTPGGRVAIPVVAQTYDATRGSSVYDQNALASEAEVIGDRTVGSANTPTIDKRYESSYRYHKKWEKHDELPTTVSVNIPTESTIPEHSELFEDSGRSSRRQYATSGIDSQSVHSASSSDRYNAAKSSSSQFQYASGTQYHGDASTTGSDAYTQTGYSAGSHHGQSSDSSQAQYHGAGSRYRGASSDSRVNAYGQAGVSAGSRSDLSSLVEDLDTKPKSYQSSYSYHKSWERQGDPYVIKPASEAYYDGQLSQRLTSSTKNQAYAGYQSGSHYGQDQADCDEHGHVRVARSYDTSYQDIQQQSQNLYEAEDLGQQEQRTWQNLEDLGQHSQSNLDQQTVGQSSRTNWENLEDLDQRSQSTKDLYDQGQQSVFSDSGTWEQYEDHRQRIQSRNDHLENLGQEAQNFLEDHPQDIVSHSPEYMPQEDDKRDAQKGNGQEGSKPDIYFKYSQVAQEPVLKPLHEIETPWDKFDINDPSKNTQKKASFGDIGIEDKTEKSGSFYWHHLPDNGGLDANIEEPERTDISPDDIKSIVGGTNDNLDPIFQSVSFDSSNYNPNVQYSYSNGFVNPSMYSHRNQYRHYEIHPQHHDDKIQSWVSNLPSDVYPQISWQQYATDDAYSKVNNFQSSSQGSSLMSFWQKIDSIEHGSGVSTGDSFSPIYSDLQNLTKSHTDQLESNLTSLERPKDTATMSEYQTPHSKTHTKLGETISQSNTTFREQEAHTPQSGQDDTHLYKADDPNGSFSIDEIESPRDIGRGDIGPEDLSSKLDIVDIPFDQPLNPSDKVIRHVDNVTQPHDQNNNTYLEEELAGGQQLTVLSIDQQKMRTEKDQPSETSTRSHTTTKLLNNNTSIDDVEIHSTHKYSTTEKQSRNQSEIGTTDIQSQTGSSKITSSILKIQSTPAIRTDTHKEKQNETSTITYTTLILNSTQYHHENETEHSILQNKTQHNLDDFWLLNKTDKIDQSHHNFLFNIPNFEQEGVNLDQQEYGQEHFQLDFDQNLEQQNLLNFGQENVHEFGQQIENLEQAPLHKIGQEIRTDIGKQNFTQPQYSLHNIGQETEQYFGNQNESLDQQNLQNFGQENIQDFEQHSGFLEQDSLHNFGQESVQDFGRQNESLDQQSFNFGQEFIQEFGQQNVNLEQQSLYNFGQESIQSFGQQNESLGHQNLTDYSQEIVQDFVQQNKSLEQSPYNLGQKSKQDFTQQNPKIDQDHEGQNSSSKQHSHTFRQDFQLQNNSLSQHDFHNTSKVNIQNSRQYMEDVQHQNQFHKTIIEEDFERANNKTMTLFKVQPNEKDIGQQNYSADQLNPHQFKKQNGNIEPQNIHNFDEILQEFDQIGQAEQDSLQDFGQQSIHDFGMQRRHVPEQSFHKLEQQGENLEGIANSINNSTLLQEYPVEIEHPLQSNSSEHHEIESSAEPVTEQTGFWKSVGSKLSNAKSKVVSWFKTE